MDKSELLSKLDKYLTDHGINLGDEHLDDETRLREYGLPAMEATKSILADLNAYSPPTGGGIMRKLKNKIINLIRNVTISTVELPMIKQNKFNELTYQFIEQLVKENRELRQKLEVRSSEIGDRNRI